MDTLKSKEINPILLVPVVAIVVLAAAYFLWLRPKMIADDALRNFGSPEAIARRDPDQRKMSDDFRKKRDELMAKRGMASGSTGRRHEE